MKITQAQNVYDVVMVGCGASGGMAAFNLTRQGVKVLLLDAGEAFDRTKYWTHVFRFDELERRRAGHAPCETVSATRRT